MIRRSSIRVTCLRCRHEGSIAAAALEHFGLSASAPISAFVKRLRCKKCGSGSVAAKRVGFEVASASIKRRAGSR